VRRLPGNCHASRIWPPPWCARRGRETRPPRLSLPALETRPSFVSPAITRAEIEQIRGVNVDATCRRLIGTRFGGALAAPEGWPPPKPTARPHCSSNTSARRGVSAVTAGGFSRTIADRSHREPGQRHLEENRVVAVVAGGPPPRPRQRLPQTRSMSVCIVASHSRRESAQSRRADGWRYDDASF